MEQPSTSLWQEFFHRRLLVVIGSYFAAVWLSIEFTSFIIERYKFSEFWLDILLWLGIGMLPTITVIGWKHGAPGKQTWGLPEKLGAPLNFLLLILGFSILVPSTKFPEEIENKSPQKQLVEQEETHELKPAEREHLLAFFFDLDNEVPNKYHWMTYGIPHLLQEYHSQQSEKIQLTSFFLNYRQGMYRYLLSKGYASGTNIPKSLKRQVTQEFTGNHYLSGRMKFVNAQLNLQVNLTDIRTQKETIVYDGKIEEFYQVTHTISNSIGNILSKSNHTLKISIEDVASPTIESYKDYIQASKLILIDNEKEKGTEKIIQNLKNERNCLSCLKTLISITRMDQQSVVAIEYIEQLLNLSYLLSENDIYYYKTMRYTLMKETKLAEETYKVWIDSHPNYERPLISYANYLMDVNWDLLNAIKYYELAVEIVPNDSIAIWKLGLLHSISGNSDKARKVYREFLKNNPKNSTILSLLSLDYLRNENYELAEKYALKSTLLPFSDSGTFSALSEIYFLQGNIEGAQLAISEGMKSSTSTSGMKPLLRKKLNQLNQLGRFNEAFDLLNKKKIESIENQKKYRVMKDNYLQYYELWLNSGRLSELNTMFFEVSPFSQGRDKSFLNRLEFDISLKQKNFKRAEFLLIEYEKEYPKLSNTGLRIKFLQATNKHREAIDMGLALLNMKGTNGFLHNKKGRLTHSILIAPSLVIHKEWQLLIENLEKDINSFPYSPEANYYLSLAYYKINEIQLARETIKKTMHMWQHADPGNEEVERARALSNTLSSLSLSEI